MQISLPNFFRRSNKAEAKRDRTMIAGLFRRNIDAASFGPRWGDTRLTLRPASEINARQGVAAGRISGMALNNPYAAAIISAFCDAAVCDGPSIRPIHSNEESRRQLIAIADRFYDEGDAEGLVNLGEALRRSVVSLVATGNVFLHMMIDGTSGALRYKHLPTSQLDRSKTFPQPLPSGGWIENGIEFSAAGKRVAYHFLKTGDGRTGGSWETVRIDAADILHAFKPLFPGQQLGLPWLAPSATHLAEIDRLEDALLAKANSAALFGMVLTRPDETGSVAKPDANGDYSMEPGATIIAPPGWDVTAVNPPNNEGTSEFLRSMIRSAAAGAGVPYELVSGDLSQTNYSSARVGLLEFRRRVTALQKNILVARILDPLWKRTLLVEALYGRIPFDLSQARAEFTFPGFEPIDPMKETNADVTAIKANLKSRHEVIAARGRDPHVVDQEISQDTNKPQTEKAA